MHAYQAKAQIERLQRAARERTDSGVGQICERPVGGLGAAGDSNADDEQQSELIAGR